MKQQGFSGIKKLGLTFCMGMTIIFTANTGNAQDRHMIDKHPAYAHALSDLRAARWLIDHKTGNWEQSIDERGAVNQIDAAMKEITTAGLDDGRRLEDHGKLEERPDHMGRLHEAMDLLKQAREDLTHGEDDAFGNHLRDRAYKNIDKAIESVKRAMHA